MYNPHSHQSILASLRSLVPRCELTLDDTKQVAERQAAKLVSLLTAAGHHLDSGVTEAHLAALPRLRVIRNQLPTDGLSYWNGREWLIVLNTEQSEARQRFTLMHEFKHILDHGAGGRLYRTDREAERVADYFAGCVLVPKPALKSAFCNVSQDVSWLADHFGASRSAIAVRLRQIGLLDPPVVRGRCARPNSTPAWRSQQFDSMYRRTTR